MKCDADDCDHEATHFETFEGGTFFKWCDKCASYIEDEDYVDGWEIISKDEYLVRQVMTA